MRAFEPKPEAGRWKPPARSAAVRHSWSAATAGLAGPVPHRPLMERAFGRDFTDVEVHLGRAAELDALDANAATDGARVAFASHNPGPRLVAHELAHVIQMRRGGGDGGRLSDPAGPSEREADRVAEAAGRGETVSVREAAPPALHRDIKSGDLEVPNGYFNIDMTKKEVADDYSGEDGHIHYKPKPTAPDSKSIRLSQAVEMKDLTKQAEFDWETELPKEADRGKMRTKGGDRVHDTVAGDTLESVSMAHFGSPGQAAQIGSDNEAVIEPVAADALTDVAKPLPAGLTLQVKGAEKAGYFIDHKASARRAKRRKWRFKRIVPQDYVWRGETHKTRNHHGSKKGDSVTEAVIYDFPSVDDYHVQYNFETVARSDDIGLYYGTLKWGFEVDATTSTPKVDKENFAVQAGVSDTFRAALTEFNKFYANPHTVLAGQTLEQISEIYFGKPDKADAIFSANKRLIGKRDAPLQPGWNLRIPEISA